MTTSVVAQRQRDAILRTQVEQPCIDQQVAVQITELLD